jgi:hypothetical protein
MSEYTEAVILCEDRQHEVFARHFLLECGINRQRIRVRPFPIGKGSAEQYVREEYPKEVLAYRRRSHHMHLCLVVVIDADIKSLDEHYKELDHELIKVKAPIRQSDERIGIFIPKRNIETWIHYLQGTVVNEMQQYPHLEKESDCKPWVEKLAANRKQPLSEDAPSSLQKACEELERIM